MEVWHAEILLSRISSRAGFVYISDANLENHVLRHDIERPSSMSAYLSISNFTEYFHWNNRREVDDGFWEEPSTMKNMTASRSFGPDIMQEKTETGSAEQYSISHRRDESLGLILAARCA